MRRIVLVICVVAMSGCGAVVQGKPPLATVAHFDLDRYLGKWYEIASLPNRFQRGCVATTATYSRIDAHTIRVVNECRNASLQGEKRRVEGTLWVAGDGSNAARLKVQFFWPFRGDYWVIGLDPDYRWAMVGHPRRKYLWILFREPVMPEALYRHLLERAASQGFDVSSVQRTLQPGA